MPVDSILLSISVVTMFLVFAGVLYWGDLQTGSMGQQPDSADRKRRGF